MKSIKLIALIAILITPLTRAEAVWDIFLNKHEKSIDNIILNTLDKPDVKWIRAQGPSNGKYSSRSLYILEKEMWDEERSVIFGFEEFYVSKHPEYRTLKDFIYVDKLVFNQKSETKVQKDVDGNLFLRRFICTGEILLETEESFCTEIQGFVCDRDINNSKDKKNLHGPEIIPEIPVDYSLCYTVDAGGKNFRKYSFQFLQKKPSEDEKKQIVEFFKSLEGQIQNVPS